MMITHKNKQNAVNYTQLLLISAWGLTIVVSSFLFFLAGYWIDGKYNTEPTFMLGLFFLAIIPEHRQILLGSLAEKATGIERTGLYKRNRFCFQKNPPFQDKKGGSFLPPFLPYLSWCVWKQCPYSHQQVSALHRLRSKHYFHE